jgi:hypothetical protein
LFLDVEVHCVDRICTLQLHPSEQQSGLSAPAGSGKMPHRPDDMFPVELLRPSQSNVRCGACPRLSMDVHLGRIGADDSGHDINVNKCATGYMELECNDVKVGKVLLNGIIKKHVRNLQAQGFKGEFRPTKVSFALTNPSFPSSDHDLASHGHLPRLSEPQRT